MPVFPGFQPHTSVASWVSASSHCTGSLCTGVSHSVSGLGRGRSDIHWQPVSSAGSFCRHRRSLCPSALSPSPQRPCSTRVSARAGKPRSPFPLPVLCPVLSMLLAMLYRTVTVSHTAPFRPCSPLGPGLRHLLWVTAAASWSPVFLLPSCSHLPPVIFLRHLSVYVNAAASLSSRMQC